MRWEDKRETEVRRIRGRGGEKEKSEKRVCIFWSIDLLVPLKP